MRFGAFVSVAGLAALAGCDDIPVSGDAPAPQPVTATPKGGPADRLEGCALTAGINGTYETETFFDEGAPLVTVLAGPNVSDAQAEKANACLEAA